MLPHASVARKFDWSVQLLVVEVPRPKANEPVPEVQSAQLPSGDTEPSGLVPVRIAPTSANPPRVCLGG